MQVGKLILTGPLQLATFYKCFKLGLSGIFGRKDTHGQSGLRREKFCEISTNFQKIFNGKKKNMDAIIFLHAFQHAGSPKKVVCKNTFSKKLELFFLSKISKLVFGPNFSKSSNCSGWGLCPQPRDARIDSFLRANYLSNFGIEAKRVSKIKMAAIFFVPNRFLFFSQGIRRSHPSIK